MGLNINAKHVILTITIIPISLKSTSCVTIKNNFLLLKTDYATGVKNSTWIQFDHLSMFIYNKNTRGDRKTKIIKIQRARQM